MGIFLAIVSFLYCRYSMKANTEHADSSQPAENLTTSSVYGMNTAGSNQQETYDYATVDNSIKKTNSVQTTLTNSSIS